MNMGKEIMMERTTFDECYNVFMKKIFWMIIIYIMANIIWIILYLLGKIEYDTFIIFIFWGNICYWVNKVPTMKAYRFIKILNRNQMKNKVQEVIFWNDLDTFFLESNMIYYYKRKIYYIDYNSIQSVYKYLLKSYAQRGAIFNKFVYDYLIVVLKNGEKYKVEVDSYFEAVADSQVKTEEMISELLKKNDKILVEETRIRN